MQDSPNKEFWDKYHEVYPGIYETGLSALSDLWKEGVEEYIKQCVGQGKVGEAGCGNGVVAESLLKANQSIHYVGYDISPVMLEGARKRLEKTPEITGRYELIVADLSKEMPGEEGSFDVVICQWMSLYLSKAEQEILLRFFRRLLKSGGMVLITVLINDHTFAELSPKFIRYEMENSPREIAVQRVENFKSTMPFVGKFFEGFTSGSMYAPDEKEQIQMLREAGFSSVEIVRTISHPSAPGDYAAIIKAT